MITTLRLNRQQSNRQHLIKMASLFLTSLFLTSIFFGSDLSADTPTLELRDGDRVVLLGDGLIEQEQYSGWVEVMLTTSFPDKHITFRNLGWSADTPAGASRLGLSLVQAGYEPANEGRTQLRKQLELTKPSVVILGYGMASALENPIPLSFTAEYKKLLNDIKAVSPNVRLLFLSPLSPVGESKLSATATRDYRDAVKQLATDNSAPFVDLTKVAQENKLRDDSIHLNDAGYQKLALTLENSLGLPASGWQTSDNTEALRQTILRKNRWWFNRSRPANMAYVFGFRKKEQGQNAVEIPQYDELIAKEESAIATLRSLKGKPAPVEPPRTKSKFAKFTPQPHPKFIVGEGLEITLWAENPMINKPIQMNFDPAGRLWVASSEAYPMIEVGQAASDKIVVLEDSTGDGKADKSSVFAEGLLIPTGVIPGDGGVYVAQSTDLLFLKDTDGDGKADQKRHVLSGFGTEDTHHNLHTLAWGYDGRLYMNQSVYTRTFTETPHGVVRLLAGGGFRFSTKSNRLQTYFRGLWNSWGHQFDKYGQSFMTDGAGFDGLAYVFPGAEIRPIPKARRTLKLISPGKYPKFCSAEIIMGESLPSDWAGSLVTCDFRANRVTRFSLFQNDAGYTTKQREDLVRTGSASFRPIDVKQGPDGALYIADWSNPIINHGEVDFRDSRRDRWHGRIWRIAQKDKPARTITNLYNASINDLLNNLNSGDRYTTDQSRRVLIERATETRRVLPAWIGKQNTDDARLQGLWLSQAIDEPNTELLDILLASKTQEVRAAAVRVLSDWANPLSDIGVRFTKSKLLPNAPELFMELVKDKAPQVRLEAVRGLSLLKSKTAMELALSVIDQPMDPFLEHALHLSIAENAETVLQIIEQPDWRTADEKRQKQLEFVLTSVRPKQASGFLTGY